MIIGVLSDTHIPNRAKKLPAAVLDSFRHVDHIIHAGDIVCKDVLDTLERLAPVTAVAGNGDPPELRDMLGEKKVLSVGGFRIGVVHGHGIKGKTLQRALESFEPGEADCIVFGHSHMPVCKYEGDVLMLNPGSPTDKRTNKYFSFAILKIGRVIEPQLVYFNKEGNIVYRHDF